MTIIQALDDDDTFGKFFKPIKSWHNWKIFLKSVYGLKLTEREMDIYHQCTMRNKRPKGFDEFYAIVGRRGGKSRIMSLIAVYEALFGKWEDRLAPGERAAIFIISTDMKQSKIILSYCSALLEDYKFGERERRERARNGELVVLNDQAESITLSNGVLIQVQAANFRGTRGFSTAVVIMDELAFWRDEASANPAEEVVNAIMPSLMTNGKLIGISSPYAKFGYLYELFDDYYGTEDKDILVWRAPTLVMNPQFNSTLIRRARKKDAVSARSEYDAEFRDDIILFIQEELYDFAVDEGRSIRPAVKDQKYYGFVDVSGGRSDSFTFGIGHEENGQVVVDQLREFVPPFRVREVVKETCDILKTYGIHFVSGDRYGAEITTQMFKEQGLIYENIDVDKSQLYIEFSTVLSVQKIRLLDISTLKKQTLQLERITGRLGKDKVQKVKGMHDDVANAAAGVSLLVYRQIMLRPSKEEIASRKIRKVHKHRPLDYSQKWGEILNTAEKEMEETLKGGKRI